MSATSDIVSIIRRKNDGKYFKVVTHPILITELNSANPNDLKGETTTMPSGDISILLDNGYELLVSGVNRSSNRSMSSYSSSNTSHRSRGRSSSHRSRGTGSTKSMSTMSTMSSRSSRNSKGGNPSRNLKSKNKTKKGKKCRY